MDSSFVWNINGVNVSGEGLLASPRNIHKSVYILRSGRKFKVRLYEDTYDGYLIIESREE